MAVKITVRTNGPYLVEPGQEPIEIVDASGNKYDLTGKTKITLCRCGASVNKPFCDGTHSRLGFQAAESAVRAAEAAAPSAPTLSTLTPSTPSSSSSSPSSRSSTPPSSDPNKPPQQS